MKKTLLIISAASLLLAGCAKEQLVDERSYTGPVTVVNATFESLTEDGTTKASVTDAGVFTWQNGDKAAFAESSASTSYCFGTNSADGTTASFAIDGEHTFTNSSLAIYPDDLTTDQVPTNLKVKVPASRVWVNEQTNVAMYGKYETASSSFSFSHMGGLVRVRVKNVPTNAREFVFKASGCKINGEFTVETESTYKVIKTATSNTESEQTYTLTLTTAPAAENTMDFYIPLPLGTYSGGFAFYLKDEEHNVLYSKVGSTSQSIARKKLLLMPAITLVGGSIEPIEKAAVVANIPAGYSGDFLLPQSEKVLLKINASTEDHNITLKYDGGTLPTNLEVKVVDGDNAGNYNAKLLGNLPSTHVEFTQGHIDATELTTSSSTLAVINPATVGTLTVKGGNVLLKGATVTSIVVDENAVASEETQAPVQIEMQKYTPTGGTEQTPAVSEITANADVVVAPESGVDVKVAAAENVKVAKDGEGTVNDKNNQPITTKAAAKIGEVKYITLADAIAAVQNGQTIIMLCDVDKANGISVPSGKNFTVDFGGHTYSTEKPGAGSANTKTQAFQLLKGSTITFKNGTIRCTEANKSHIWSSGDAVKGVAMIIQNYANLTLENMTIDATNIAQNGDDKNVRYAVSTNHGSTTFSENTTIITEGNDIAFDSCDSQNQVDEQNYPGKPTVTWDSKGSVTGGIELSGGNFVVKQNLAVDKPIVAIDDDNVDVSKSSLTVESGVTISTGANFEDLNPTLTNKHATGLVQVKRGAKLSVSGTGTIDAGDKSKTYSAAYVTVKGDNTAKTATLDVNGTTLKGYYYAIAGNGNRPNTVINLTDAKVYGTSTGDGNEAALGIYHPQMGTLTINGSSTEIKGKASGIEMRAGTLVVNNGKIEGTAAGYTVQANGSGSTTVGAGIAIAPHTTGKDISVTINGGEIKGNQAISNANPQNQTSEVAVTVNGGTFSDLSGVKYVADNATYTLGADVANAAGMTLDTKKTFTVDFGDHTYTVNKPGAGSTNTQTQAFQLIAGQNITFKNGTIKAADANLNATSEGDVKPIKRFIQNYANLTLTNMTFDGTNINGENSVVEFCNGNVTIDGTTNFTAKSGVASINVDSWKGSYPNGTAVTINTTSNVGKIHCYTEGTGSMTTKSSLTIKNGKNITIDDVSNGEVVVSIEGGTFSDLSGVKYIADNKTYTLGADVTNAVGMAFDTKKTFTVDFGGHTYTVNKPGAGSTNTQTLAFQLLADQTITFKNGTIKAATENLNATESDGKKPIKRFIQNYANLTLTDMTLDGTNINGDNSVVEFCNGNVVVDGSTNFTAKTNVASINVDSWTAYPNGTNVTINTTGKVGKIYCYSEGSGQMTKKSKLTIVSGEDITIEHKTEGDVDVDDQRTN